MWVIAKVNKRKGEEESGKRIDKQRGGVFRQQGESGGISENEGFAIEKDVDKASLFTTFVIYILIYWVTSLTVIYFLLLLSKSSSLQLPPMNSSLSCCPGS